LQTVLGEQRARFDAASVGRVLDVLFEKPGRRAGQAIGRTAYLQAVHVENASGYIGEIRPVHIDAVFPNSLKGSLVTVREKAMSH
jgi:tRNA-2-methylthio-N6-dimethylallyladenosine synthase